MPLVRGSVSSPSIIIYASQDWYTREICATKCVINRAFPFLIHVAFPTAFVAVSVAAFVVAFIGSRITLPLSLSLSLFCRCLRRAFNAGSVGSRCICHCLCRFTLSLPLPLSLFYHCLSHPPVNSNLIVKLHLTDLKYQSCPHLGWKSCLSVQSRFVWFCLTN